MDNTYYFGYGLNTNRSSMRQRCPAAQSLGHALLRDHQFRFAHHADVVQHSGALVHGVLWVVTAECMQSLDRLESYPHYYDRKIVSVEHRGRHYDAWMYTMQPGHELAEPHGGYWSSLITGYSEHSVPNSQLYRALRAAENAHRARTPLDNKYHSMLEWQH